MVKRRQLPSPIPPLAVKFEQRVHQDSVTPVEACKRVGDNPDAAASAFAPVRKPVMQE